MENNIATAISNTKLSTVTGVVLSVPELFADKAFQEYLNSTQTIMSWHKPGAEFHADDWDDTVIFLCPTLSGEGSNSDMPYHDEIVERVKAHFPQGVSNRNHIAVILRGY